MRDPLWDQVLDTAREYGMFSGRHGEPGSPGHADVGGTSGVAGAFGVGAVASPSPLVLVGASGGPDSTVLLHVLASLVSELGVRLHVTHLNHGFRGEEAAKDAAYARELAGELGLPFSGGVADVPAMARREGLSAQDAARRARYAFFRQVGAETGASFLALGHTLDDQAETVLMRLLRGAGSGGLSGIPPVRVEGGLVIVRPLIRTSREEVEAYCRRHALEPRTDQSNLKPVYLRNRVRLELLPALRRMEPQVGRHLAQSAEILAAEDEFLDTLATAALEGMAGRPGPGPGPDGILLRRPAFLDLPVALQRRVLRAAYAHLSGDAGDLDFAHGETLRHAFRGPAGLTLQLPGGVWAVTEHDLVVLRHPKSPERRGKSLRRREARPPATGPGRWVRELAVPGRTAVPELGLAIEASVADVSQMRAKAGLLSGVKVALECALDYNRIAMPLLVRTRRTGDRFQPLGMTGTKKLADFFVDAHVPREGRDRVPIVVTAGDDVVWVGGHRIADSYRMTSATSTVLQLTIVPLDSPERHNEWT